MKSDFTFRWVILLFISILPLFLSAQIVNIEAKRISADSAGWYGSLSAGMDINKFDKWILNLKADANIAYLRKKHSVLFISNARMIKAGSTDFVNSAFQHVRYNYDLNAKITFEAFTQVQYNALLKVKNRMLLGMGPRWGLAEGKTVKMYLGTLGMFEYEEINTTKEIHRDMRISSYLSMTWFINKMCSFSNTNYYQPKITDFDDFRISSQSKLRFDFNKKLSFFFMYDGIYDSRPPVGVLNLVFSLSNGFGYKF
jgi:hypothetical protein